MTTARPHLARGLGVLLVLGAAVAVTPAAARAVGLVVDVPARLEVIDHVVPGIAVVLAGAGGLLAVRRGNELLVAVAVAVAVLAGIWTTSTHVPLLAQAAQGLVTWPAATFHTVPGLLLLGTAAALLLPLLRGRP